MPLLSYAQNGEDVVLYRALKDIERGHYIDVGACDPTEYSVTKLFYDLGWSGVNIEPSRGHHVHLEAERTNDLNLNVAVAARSGILKMHHIPSTGLSTIIDEVALSAQSKGFTAERVDVPVLTLADICRDLPFSTTHFLKIDVEGGEKEVLLGTDFTAFRPWIIVIEATAPLSTERTDAEWRGILEAADYECVLFDGLNLYFLAREHVELRERLEAPANVLDDYVPARLMNSQQAERDAFLAERDRIEAAFGAERASLQAAIEGEREVFAAERARLEAAFGCERDVVAADRARLEATFQAERGEFAGKWARLEAAFKAEREMFAAERARIEGAFERERARAELQRMKRRKHDDHVQRLNGALLEARETARLNRETLDLERGRARQQARVEAKRHLAERAADRAQVAYYQMQDELLRRVSELLGAGTHLEERGSELQDLRASLLRQADAWEAEVEDLRHRLEEALAWPDLIQASTSWRVTSPLRSIRRRVQGLRHGPGRFSRLVGQRANLLGRPGPSNILVDDMAVGEPAPSVETGVPTLVSLVAGLDSAMAFLADLLGCMPAVLSADVLGMAGPFYAEARLDEQLTHWIRADVVRQRRAAL